MMKNNTHNNKTFIQALELLPWHALGLLNAQEKAHMEKALLDFPELETHLTAEHEMIQYLNEERALFSSEAIEDREARLAQLLQHKELQQIKEDQTQQSTQITTAQILQEKLHGFLHAVFSGHIRKEHYMGFAAIATVSIALLFAFAMPTIESKSSTFYPAAIESDEIKQKENTLLVGLAVSPDDPALLAILQKFEVEVSATTGKDGMYHFNFIKKSNASDAKKLLEVLSAQKELVWFVGEAY